MSNSTNDLKGKYFRVLDKGYIGVVDWMGDDFDIEAAARTSYGKGTRKVSDTNNLLRYLMRHHHSTPFEMAEIKFHVKVPMDCWRQWIRHRTASVNEYSTRYSEAIDERQVTTKWRAQSTTNKQGSGDGEILWANENQRLLAESHPPKWTTEEYLSARERDFHNFAQEIYQERINSGVAKEQARKDLPLSTYTVAYWKMDLKNLLHFMSLRCDSHAQLEIREYANVIAGVVKELFPITFQAWYDYHFTAVNFTRLDRLLLQKYFDVIIPTGGFFDPQEIENAGIELGMSKREVAEWWEKTEPPQEQDFGLDFSKVIDMEKENG